MSFALVNQCKNKAKADGKMLMTMKSPAFNTLGTNSQDYLVSLQQTTDNQAVQQLMRSHAAFDFRKIGIQPKLKVSHPGDTDEQEAARVAEQVLRMSVDNSITPAILKGEDRIDRKCSACEMNERKKEHLKISRKSSAMSNPEAVDETTNKIHSILTSAENSILDNDNEKERRKCTMCKIRNKEEEEEMRINRKKSPNNVEIPDSTGHLISSVLSEEGSPLDTSTLKFMESHFGFDFSKVRIHTNKHAARSAEEVKALAYTVGHHIVFGAGQYAPQLSVGRMLLAHELVHTIQQGIGIHEKFKQSSNPFCLKAKTGQTIHHIDKSASRGQDTSHVKNPTISEAIPKQIQRISIKDCSAENSSEITGAARMAIPAIRRTISAILEPRPPAALIKYFGSSAPSYAAHIGLRLAIIASRIYGATIECENPGSLMYNYFCGSNLAYVRGIPAFFGMANIHVCQPAFHGLTQTQRMTTLVHEAAHRYIDADDEAYYTLDCGETAATAALSDSDRRDNADSYGCLVQTLG
jgi:Domain of unknown function (DUF4157)